MSDIPRKMAKGAAWLMFMSFTMRLLGLVSSMFLARLLVPEDFGLIALAMSILGLLEVMGTFNFDLALIQNQQAQRHHYDTAWTLNILYATFTGLMMAALAAPAAAFYRDPRLEGIMYVLAVYAIVPSFGNIGTVNFRKELNFQFEFGLIVSGKLIAVTVTVGLAYFLRTYWALAIGSLVSSLITVAITYRMHPFRPRFALRGWRDLMNFSGWMLFSNLLIFAGNRSYDFLIGRIAGPAALGLYTIAYELANLPTTQIVWPATKAIFPGFAKMTNDADQLKRTFLNAAALVALITIPAGAGVAVLAEPMVRLFLGEKWLAAVPLIQILAVFGILRAMHAGAGSVFLALGMTRIAAWVSMPHIIIGLPLAAFLLIQHGLEAATAGVTVAGAIALAMVFVIIRRVLALTFAELGECYWRPLGATAAMVAVEWALLVEVKLPGNVFYLAAWTLSLIAIGVIVYVGSMLVLWQIAGRPAGAEKILLVRLRALYDARRAKPAS